MGIGINHTGYFKFLRDDNKGYTLFSGSCLSFPLIPYCAICIYACTEMFMAHFIFHVTAIYSLSGNRKPDGPEIVPCR